MRAGKSRPVPPATTWRASIPRARMYACPNIATAVNVVHADRNTPGFMRAPPETPYMFALESAMDELAYELNMDPIELRRVNDTQTDPVKGLPFSSRSLMQCFDQAAARFGWTQRNPSRARCGTAIGWSGTAAPPPVIPPTSAPAAARLSVTPERQGDDRAGGPRNRHRRLHHRRHHRRARARLESRGRDGAHGRQRSAARHDRGRLEQCCIDHARRRPRRARRSDAASPTPRSRP